MTQNTNWQKRATLEQPLTYCVAAVLFPCQNKNTMGPRADKHDDVYDRQIRLWGADAQVCGVATNSRVYSCNYQLLQCS